MKEKQHVEGREASAKPSPKKALASGEPKFTPGPWRQSHRERGGMYNTEVYDSSGETIATLAWHRGRGSNGITSTDRPHNAHLIAAAPDLYTALEALWNEVARYESIGHEGSELLEVMSDARAALAKARGETNAG